MCAKLHKHLWCKLSAILPGGVPGSGVIAIFVYWNLEKSWVHVHTHFVVPGGRLCVALLSFLGQVPENCCPIMDECACFAPPRGWQMAHTFQSLSGSSGREQSTHQPASQFMVTQTESSFLGSLTVTSFPTSQLGHFTCSDISFPFVTPGILRPH